MPPPKVSQDFLKSILEYDPDIGLFLWKKRPAISFEGDEHGKQTRANKWNGRFAGKQAFTAKNTGGYFHTKINDRVYLAHRVAWVIQFGEWPNIIDHINGRVDDNRICNLRNVSKSANGRNRRISSNNASGFSGVSFRSDQGKWHAAGGDGKKRRHLGLYDTKSEAVKARAEFEISHGYTTRHD